MRLFVLIIAVSNLVLAKSICPAPPGSVIESIVISTSETSCDIAHDMATVLTEVSRQLNIPIKLSLNITGPDNNAGFDDGLIIEIPSQYIYQTGYQQTAAVGTLQQLQTIVIHEFGHALFNQILKSKLEPEFKILFDSLLADSQTRLKSLLTRQDSPRKQGAVSIDQKLLNRYLAFISPYNELFADTVAVYFTNDPSALLSALYFDELTNKEFKHLQLRDFKADHAANNPELDTDPHSKMAPTRSFIGKHMMAKTDAEKQKMIRILANAIITLAQKDLTRASPPSALKANQNLISLLKAALYATN